MSFAVDVVCALFLRLCCSSFCFTDQRFKTYLEMLAIFTSVHAGDTISISFSSFFIQPSDPEINRKLQTMIKDVQQLLKIH